MDYNEFLEYVKSHISEELTDVLDGKEYRCEIAKVTKNNGVTLDGLTIHVEGATISPNIYLNNYYEQYHTGLALKTILIEIAKRYKSSVHKEDFNGKDIYYYERIKDYIIVRLVNYEKNKELLKNCPFVPFHDLAVTFRWLAHKDDVGIATSLITNAEMERWDVDIDELYKKALCNTKRLFPERLVDIEHMLEDFADMEDICIDIEKEKEDCGIELYVLTNESGVNGATAVLYENVLENFARQINRNLFVLPSSIHEMILIPDYHSTTKESLHNLVKEANQTVVGRMDVLSDSVYYYNMDQREIEKIK